MAPSFRAFCAFVCDAHLRAFVGRSVGASRFASIHISREDRVYAKPRDGYLGEACANSPPRRALSGRGTSARRRGTAAHGGTAGSRWHRGSSEMLAMILVLLALGGVAARCLYAPDANGHVVVPEGVTSIGDSSFNSCDTLLLSRRARRGSPCCCA